MNKKNKKNVKMYSGDTWRTLTCYSVVQGDDFLTFHSNGAEFLLLFNIELSCEYDPFWIGRR